MLDSADGLAEDAGDVLKRVQALLSDSALADAGSAVSSLRDLLEGLADATESQAGEVRSLLASLNRSAENVEGITEAEEWRRTLASADSVLAGASRASSAVEQSVSSLNAVLARIERGRRNPRPALGKRLAVPLPQRRRRAASRSSWTT